MGFRVSGFGFRVSSMAGAWDFGYKFLSLLPMSTCASPFLPFVVSVGGVVHKTQTQQCTDPGPSKPLWLKFWRG